MGLASKLAAAQAGGGGLPASLMAGGGRPPQQQQSYGQPQQQSYPPPGGNAQPYGQQQQGGYPPQGGQQGYGQPQQSPYGQPQGQSPYGQPQQQSSYGQQQQSYPPPGGAPPPVNAGQRPGQQQGYPPQQQQGYGAPPPGYPPQGQGQYGAPPGQQQQQHQQSYGAPPTSGGGGNAGAIEGILRSCIVEQKIQSFYPPNSPAVSQIAQRVSSSGVLDRIAAEWRMPREIASDLCKLALFDTILYLDDSGSLAFEEGGERIEDLKLIVNRVAYAASLFDDDGIQVRFMNNQVEGNNIKNEAQALDLISRVKFSGLTPLGTGLQRKVLEPLVLGPARAGRLQKPVLIITVTDGCPAGEDRRHIFNVVSGAVRELQRMPVGADAVSFGFAQVGNDQKARAFLEELDKDPVVGSLVDCTSNYENEADEMMKTSGVELSPELWLMLGAIDDSYDAQDETARR